MFNCYVLRYGEIFLKGKNRRQFEIKLVNNIRDLLIKKKIDAKIKLKRNRILLYYSDGIKELSNVFGLKSYSQAIECSFDDIKENSLKMYTKGSFRVTSKRLTKDNEFSSQKLNEDIGEY